MNDSEQSSAKIFPIGNRFRGYLPVVVDVETAGFNSKTDALLEVAAVIVAMDDSSQLDIANTLHYHVKPFEGANLEKEALAFNQIDPYHPFRMAVSEQEALSAMFKSIRRAIAENNCTRAILVGHNATFDLHFINAAAKRCGIKRNPFHPFSCFDTVSLAGLMYGQTVLARAAKAAGLDWDNEAAHSAKYDAEQTARLFCTIVNTWLQKVGQPISLENKAENKTDPDL